MFYDVEVGPLVRCFINFGSFAGYTICRMAIHEYVGKTVHASKLTFIKFLVGIMA